MRRYYLFFSGLAVLAVLAITTNTWLRRGPVHDANAAADIETIDRATGDYVGDNNRLPARLSQLKLTMMPLKAPLTDYAYTRLGTATYQICTTFMTARQARYVSSEPDPATHGKGRQCFVYDHSDKLGPSGSGIMLPLVSPSN